MMDHLPPDYAKQYGNNFKLWKFIGIDVFESPENSRRNKITVCFFSAYFILTYILAVIPMCQSTYLIDALKSCPMLLLSGQEIIKVIISFNQRAKCRRLVEDLGALWPNDDFDTAEMSNMFSSDMKLLGLLQRSYFLACFIVIIIFFFGGTIYVLIFHHDDPTKYAFAVQMTHLFEVKGVVSYILCVLMEAGPFVILFNCSTVPVQELLLIIIGITRTLFRLLRLALDHETNTCIMNGNYSKQDIDKRKLKALKNIVRSHQKLLKIVDDANVFFGASLFLTMLLYSVIICLYAFFAIVGDSVNAILNMLPAISLCLSIYVLHCMPGQLLVDSSFEVSEAAYRYMWYTSNRDIQLCIKMIIMRSNKPIYITGFGFFQLSHPCFTNIMSGAMSYFSLLWKMYHDTEET